MRQFLLERYRLRIFPVLAVVAVIWLVAGAARDGRRPPAQVTSAQPAAVEPVVAEVDAFFASEWQKLPIAPAGSADDLQILRRLSLALHGTVPSLEEIREFEADAAPQRLERWTARLLADHRFGDYFAERLARGLVGVEGGQFIIFRRDRFKTWLSEQLQKNTPYDVLVRQMIAEQGLWTGEPATNFITAAVNEGDFDENKLAGRSVRAFLGQRIDCAQCHDHPFDDWKQQDFEGLAAFYGQVRQTIGISDDAKGEYQVEDRKTREQRTIEPGVPFHPEWLPTEGSRRQRLAAWITHADNRRFERAVANRVWALMFGRAYTEPVDNLPDPSEDGAPDLLDILGRDFREHGCDLKRLVQVIAASKPFRLDSAHPCDDETQFVQ
ncbi:MAG TPA: DUF1549 domain-containing protein, partial [Planctomycetaceae bacterium]|nr:DUF1549 domain-containing protein [Planctomycetaceae bacterium]